nr:WW domain-binding protein 11-like [Equus asinus]
MAGPAPLRPVPAPVFPPSRRPSSHPAPPPAFPVIGCPPCGPPPAPPPPLPSRGLAARPAARLLPSLVCYVSMGCGPFSPAEVGGRSRGYLVAGSGPGRACGGESHPGPTSGLRRLCAASAGCSGLSSERRSLTSRLLTQICPQQSTQFFTCETSFQTGK